MTGGTNNGASLEDCHTNFFGLTDICGIKWIVYRENDQPPSLEVTEDPVLQSFARCLESNLLSVWRRVPKRSLVSNSYDMPPPPRHYDDKNYISQRKELWIFWYGEKPDDIKKVLSPQLTEVPDISGTWENVLSYEARTLLYKALQNVLERCLLSRDFVRLGRWFVQPFDGPEKSLQKASHLSFAFSYFIHGESHVCVTLDVRQHPAVRRLSLHHINNAKSQTAPIQVVLAPYGLSASLIGASNKSHDHKVAKMLKDWEKFYPLDRNRYFTRNTQGDFVSMPPAVEVLFAGVRMLYPTCYVLVTDLDVSAHFGDSQTSNIAKAAHASRDTEECTVLKQDAFSIEPSPYTANSHPLLASSEMFRKEETIPETELAWLDGIRVDPDATSLPNDEANQTNIPTLISQHWNFVHPGRYVKKKHKSKQSSREKSKDRSKFNSKFPFHKKTEALDASAWAIDHTAMIMPGGVNVGGMPVGGHRTNSANCFLRPPNSVRAVDTSVHSPASVGAVPTPLGSVMTPKGGPSSVRTPCDMTASLASPAECKAPLTPKSVPSSYPVSSPFPTSDKKTEMKNDQEDSCLSNGGGSIVAATASPSGVTTYVSRLLVSNSDQLVEKLKLPLKRPHLPLKEYESEIGQESEFFAEHLYDTEDMQHWLNYPVKKFCRLPEKTEDPPRPMYRRPSQSSDSPADSQTIRRDDENMRQLMDFPEETLPSDIFDLSEEETPTNLFTNEGLVPSMADLNNIFEDSSEETEPPVTVPTPPGSNKPALLEDDNLNYTKVKTTVAMRVDPTGNLPHDQLAKMFPTPPSHEHNPVASPADITSSDADHLPPHLSIKMEPLSPEADHSEWATISDDLGIMLASSKYAPLKRLYSDDFDPIAAPVYTPLISGPPARSNRSNNSGNSSSGPNSVGTPTGLASSRVGMSPISPLASVEGPRSQQGPGSVGGGFQGNSVGHQHDPAPSPHFLNKQEALDQKTPEISAILLNIALSDSLMNLHRDHNFASCIMCVCSNDCNIRGRDASVYVPDKGSDDFECMCGFSAVVNRKLAYNAGLFYEDEKEVTGLTEDLYYRKNPSLLVEAKPGDNVAEIPNSLIELVLKQSSLSLTQHSSIVKYSNQYLKSSHTQATVSTVEKMDANEVIFSVLDQIVTLTQSKNVGTSEPHKLDENQKDSCIHKWTLLQVPGPLCSEDIIRVMRALRPILQDALHVKKVISGSRDSSTQSVQGPLTWKEFFKMAGPMTKGNTDDRAIPLPVPFVTVGNEKCLTSVSPTSLRFWDLMAMEPFSQPRDIAYIVVAPDNPFLLECTKKFFRNLSVTYETCRLGRHAPITKVLGDGILKVGKKQAEKLANDETDTWFELIGDSPTASLVRLYSKVCHHYLLPLLHPLPLDRSLLDGGASQRQVLTEKPPASPMPPPNSANHDALNVNNSQMQISQEKPVKYGDIEDINGKENALGGMSDPGAEDNGEGDTPAIVIYMVDPFTLHEGNYDSRLACLGLLQSFSQMLPRLNDLMRHNIHLQLITVDSIFELTQSRRQPRLADQLRGLAFSVYSQSQRPLRYQRDCKTLTGFGPASSAEQYLKQNNAKAEHVEHLYCPSYSLSPLPNKLKTASEAEEGGDRSATVLFCNYFLSEDQHWLLATCCDDRGELLKTVTINIEIPNKTRRKRASARRVGLRKLMDWILGIMAMALVPWRLVIGRIGRIGHGELKGWSVLLSRKALQRASKDLRGMCKWQGDVPSILSACLVSVEPDPTLRLMADQFTPDERFGQTSSNGQLSTPRDLSCTHLLVFPTSAKAQSSQKADKDEIAENDDPLLDINFEDMDNVEAMDDIADFKDLFNDNDWSGGGGQPGSPKSPTRYSISRPNSPGGMMHDRSDQFRYGQEVPGDQIEVQQQPLALGYLVSTAPTGPMPKWFWSTCPHLENVCPVFMKTSLHINVASVMLGGDDGFTPVPKSGKVHSLDSTYTADVLRFVLESYNSLSWLDHNPETHDRKSCFPVHVQILQQMYNSFAALF